MRHIAIRGILLIAVITAGFSNASAAELIMVDEVGCPWCQLWEEEIGVVYHKTDEGRRAPLRRIDIHDPLPADLTLDSLPVYTPTFILVDQGQEVGRIEGYPGEDFFWGLLQGLLTKLSGQLPRQLPGSQS